MNAEEIKDEIRQSGESIELWIEKIKNSGLSGGVKHELVKWLEDVPKSNALVENGEIDDFE